MSGNAADEVVVAGDGKVFVAPIGTTFPTFPSTPSTPWIELGYFKTDGVGFKLTRDSKDIEAFQSLDPLRTVITKRPIELNFKLMQTGAPQVELALGGGSFAEIGTSNTYKYTPADVSFVDERALLLEIVDGDDVFWYEFPRVVNKSGVEFSFKRDEEVSFPITMSVLRPASGDVFNIFTDAPQFEGQS